MKILLKNYLARIRFDIKSFNDMCLVKGARPLVNILKGMLVVSGLRVTLSKIKVIVHLCRTLNHLVSTQGPKGACLYLKTCSVSLQQALGEYYIKDVKTVSGVRPSRNRKGLPRLIRADHRNLIRNRHFNIARFYLTFFNLYRNLLYLGTPGLKSIVEPSIGTGAVDTIIYGYIPDFVRLFVFDRIAQHEVLSLIRKYAGKMPPIFRSAPGAFKLIKGGVEEFYNFSTHPVVLIRQAISLAADKSLAIALMNILGFTQDKHINKQFMAIIGSKIGALLNPLQALGKLGAKVEAAGKVRIFAMVDAWTQWALAPLHRAIFDILKGIPMDGTFDQLAPLNRSVNWTGLYSLDLSAATDRLPIKLQIALLGALLGNPQIADAWAHLLVGRFYKFSDTAFERFNCVIKYAVGQPMGALSSWAMLAFTHHFMVQCAAWMAGKPSHTLYLNYAVLGDDLVIGDADVMVCYLAICESLGVKVGLHKSLLSPKGLALEFAKRTVWLGVDVSPIPLSEFHAACQTLPQMLEFIQKYKLDPVDALRAFGFGWRTLTWLNKPLGKLSANVRLIILGLSMPSDAESAEEFFLNGSPRLLRYHNDVASILAAFNKVEVGRLRKEIQAFLDWLVRINPVSWAGKSVEILRQLSKADAIATAKRLDQTKGLALLNKFVQMDWYVAWPVILKLIESIWDPLTKDLYMKVYDLQGRIPHTYGIDDPFVFYIKYIQFLREWSTISRTPFSTVRPEGWEGMSNRRPLPPIQVRLWKKWSGIIQNTQSVQKFS